MTRTVTLLLAAGLVGWAPRVRAGPLEARARYAEAQSRKEMPWHHHASALRTVLCVTHPSDSLYRRTLRTLASTCRKAGLVHAAAAYDARAARLGPRRSKTRLRATFDQARALRAEGDRDASASLLERVAATVRNLDARLADRARAAQTEDLEAARDTAGLETLVRAMEREDAGAATQLGALDALGVLRLEAGDPLGARKALERAERVHRRALRRDDDEATRSARAWLRLRLPRRLAP